MSNIHRKLDDDLDQLSLSNSLESGHALYRFLLFRTDWNHTHKFKWKKSAIA